MDFLKNLGVRFILRGVADALREELATKSGADLKAVVVRKIEAIPPEKFKAAVESVLRAIDGATKG